MSGVVVTMNDDEDDEDVTGLLGDPSSAASRFKRYNNKPYPVVRSGNISQWLNTLVLCCVFFGMVRLRNRITEDYPANSILHICLQGSDEIFIGTDHWYRDSK